MTLQFLQLLPSPEGKTWITSAYVDHNVRQTDMIFHILDDSFKVKTDGTTIPYAQSLERTLGWIKQYASKFEPRPLVVGKTWGVVASDSITPTEFSLTHIDSFQLENQTHQTYRIGYYLVKESFIQIKDGFPFPMQAVIYKPISSHHDIPLAFTAKLLSFSSTDQCSMLVFDEKITPVSEANLEQNYTTQNQVVQYDESLDNPDEVFDIISTEDEIMEIESNKNDENHTLAENYEKLEQLFGNLPGFLQILTVHIKQIIENQTK